MRRQLLPALGVVGSLVLGVTACGDTTEPPRGADPADAADAASASAGLDPDIEADLVDVSGDRVEVNAQDNEFVDRHIRIEAGATVVWSNDGRQDHDVIPVDGTGPTGDWGVDISGFTPGEVYEHTFDEPGIYPYYCSLHGTEDAGMVGTIVVE